MLITVVNMRLHGYLQVRSPLSFPVQQRVEDASAGLAARLVVPGDHVVRGANALEELLVHVLGVAVVGNVGQVHINGKTGSACRAGLLGSWSGEQNQSLS